MPFVSLPLLSPSVCRGKRMHQMAHHNALGPGTLADHVGGREVFFFFLLDRVTNDSMRPLYQHRASKSEGGLVKQVFTDSAPPPSRHIKRLGGGVQP